MSTQPQPSGPRCPCGNLLTINDRGRCTNCRRSGR